MPLPLNDECKLTIIQQTMCDLFIKIERSLPGHGRKGQVPKINLPANVQITERTRKKLPISLLKADKGETRKGQKKMLIYITAQ